MVAVTDPYVPIPGSERRPASDARRVGPVNPEERMTVSVQVRRKAGAQLTNLAQLGTTRPRDRQRPDRAAQATEHAADQADLGMVEQFAKRHGLKKEGFVPPRTLQFSGTAQQMGEAFGTQLSVYEHQGDTYRGREGHVCVPRNLVGVVERVSGLTTRQLAQPRLRQRLRETSSFQPSKIAQLYNFPEDADGSGTCIGIIELGGGYQQSDLDMFFQGIGLPTTPTVVDVGVDGATNDYGVDPRADAEVALDIQIAGAVAPGARIAAYFAPNTEQGFIDAVNAAVFDTDNRPSVLSISWGADEDTSWTTAGRNGLDVAFTNAATAGVSVLAAAGDNGSNDSVGDGLAHCDFPASDPFVIACGGTTLQTDDLGEPTVEIVWNDGFGDATGGGISLVFPPPSWQAGSGIPANVNDGTTYGRGLPDITGDADPNTGYDVVVGGSWTVVGGTSAVAPLYAGLFARIIGRVGFPLGFVTPYLYFVGSNGSSVFYDVSMGDNSVPPAPGYDAGVGWDACSGLGRLDGTQLLSVV